MWAPFYGAKYKNDIVVKIAKQWKYDAAIIHLNHGCEVTVQHQMEMKIVLQKNGAASNDLQGKYGR